VVDQLFSEGFPNDIKMTLYYAKLIGLSCVNNWIVVVSMDSEEEILRTAKTELYKMSLKSFFPPG